MCIDNMINKKKYAKKNTKSIFLREKTQQTQQSNTHTIARHVLCLPELLCVVNECTTQEQPFICAALPPTALRGEIGIFAVSAQQKRIYRTGPKNRNASHVRNDRCSAPSKCFLWLNCSPCASY